MAGQTELSFMSSDSRTTVYATLWEPEGEPVGVVQICHGMAEHIGRYAWLAGQLCAKGYVVCGDDHLGHGRTALTKDDLGYFGERDGWDHLIEDEHGMRKELGKTFPGPAVFPARAQHGLLHHERLRGPAWDRLSGYICWGTSGPVPGTGLGIFLTTLLCVFGQGENAAALSTSSLIKAISTGMTRWKPSWTGSAGIGRYTPPLRRIPRPISFLPTRDSGICSVCLKTSAGPVGAGRCPRGCPSSSCRGHGSGRPVRRGPEEGGGLAERGRGAGLDPQAVRGRAARAA